MGGGGGVEGCLDDDWGGVCTEHTSGSIKMWDADAAGASFTMSCEDPRMGATATHKEQKLMKRSCRYWLISDDDDDNGSGGGGSSRDDDDGDGDGDGGSGGDDGNGDR